MTTELAELNNQYTLTNHPQDKDMLIAKKILAEVIDYRRLPESFYSCKGVNCQKCTHKFLPNIILAVKKNKPIIFVLPAFPGKSPNSEKVLGYLPDYAEIISLKFFATLCQKIKQFYQPGIKIILCSDGRVFSDVIGMQEQHVTAYQTELDRLIKTMSLSDISTFNLDHLYSKVSFTQMRQQLMENYGESIENIKNKIRQGTNQSSSIEEQSLNRLYRGITRFLFEDAKYPGQLKSNTTLQKESRQKAYEVIRRSNAWSQLIKAYFPYAVRLSIHPHTCGSEKLGIRLIANEVWMTPWHGVAVKRNDQYILLKRSQAESLGAKLIYFPDGRPSHYQLHEDNMN
ncbi:MAG: pyoverdine biosynthesis protein PvcA [Gammaproteobacteria bacterium]|nr:MAG: pyoverdine biosynthesis protein PvcA [Gammaproteobacteria bacterium]UTW43606.1 isocyanide synthase family protein [bacterium SCSIO 12844]